MKSVWVFKKVKVNSRLPSWASALTYPSKTITSANPSSETPRLVLNHVDITLLLPVCGRDGYLNLGYSLHASIVKNPELFDPCNPIYPQVVWNSLLTFYTKCGELRDAIKLFDQMPMKDTVSWNSIISGFLRNDNLDLGFGYFKRMYNSCYYHFDHATLTTILSACDGPDLLYVNRIIHGLVFLSGYEREITVNNALITSYYKCHCFSSGKQIFEEMTERNVITWTAAISGLAQNELYEESLRLFVRMRCGTVNPNFLTCLSSLLACSGLQGLREGRQIHGLIWKLGIQSDFCIESALMDMYSECGSVEEAWRIFESAEVLDEVSVTAILVGLAQNGFKEEAIHIFVKMVKAGIKTDPNMLSAILGVFSTDTSLALGKQMHSLIIKKSFGSNPFVSNGLINMYSKCGDLEESVKVFDRMPQRNSVSWNSVIAAFARHGNCYRALELYEEMRSEGVEPTDVTFLSLLHACSHVGLVGKGIQFLESMDRDYGISPRMEHYACVVDMLGRAGLLDEAKNFIEELPVKPDILVWQALLGACSFHGNPEMGKYAADQLFMAQPGCAAPYILMANIYSSKGQWKERAGTIKKMKEMGVAKETGISWIEIEKKVHSFVVADQMHPQGKIIYCALLGLFRHMRDEGYVPDKRFILHYLNCNEKKRTTDSLFAANLVVGSCY